MTKGVNRTIIAGLMVQYQAKGKSWPNSRSVYLGQVRWACWKISRTSVRSPIIAMKIQKARSRITSAAIFAGLDSGRSGGEGGSLNAIASPTLPSETAKPTRNTNCEDDQWRPAKSAPVVKSERAPLMSGPCAIEPRFMTT